MQYVTQGGKLLTSERLSSNIVLLAGHFLESLWLCALCWTPLKPSMLDMVWKHYITLLWRITSQSSIKHPTSSQRSTPYQSRGGSRGRVQGMRTPLLPPWDDLRFSNTTGILQKKKRFIGVEVEQETSAPPPKKILDPPLQSPNPLPSPFILRW